MNRKKLLILSIFMFLLIAPFLFACFSHRQNEVFGGFLLNPIDGNSYLAKIQQGYAGEWKFQLPYTAQRNGDIFLFTFYILLGHIARFLSISPLWIFHIARIGMAVCLFFSIDKFLSIFEVINQKLRWIIFCTLLFGGGLGWLYMFSGDLPADFWVAEAFPFLSAFSNPHFTLSLTLMMYGYYLAQCERLTRLQLLYVILIGILLSNISPFAVAIVLLFFATHVIVYWRRNRKGALTSFLLFSASSMPVIIYQYFTILSDPVLRGWNAQNITPAPSVLNLLFSFSPFLIGIDILLLLISRHEKLILKDKELGLIVWIIAVIFLLYLPLNLQRRFLIAFYVPVVTLFFILLERLTQISTKYQKEYEQRLSWVFFYLALPSVAFVLIGSIGAILNNNQKLFVPAYIVNSADWLMDNTKGNSVILSSPETGLFLPAYSNVKSVYGHPFETINAEQTRSEVEDFWSGALAGYEEDILLQWNVDYIFFGPEESKIGRPEILDHLPVIYTNQYVKIYEVAGEEN